jgi:Methyltransferase domain
MMDGVADLRAELQGFEREHGAWTAMAIHLGGGIHTRRPEPDPRLLRVVQTAADLIGKPIDQLRVLDLACLEGHYGIELALHGAHVVGMELRAANLAKAAFAVRRLGLESRVELLQEDVCRLSRNVHGEFDLVICSGILYHLDVPAVFDFVERIYEVCTRMVVFDTQIALSPRATVEHRGRTYSGLWYEEGGQVQRLRDVWAAVHNDRSFWLTAPSLGNLMAHVGFSSFYECLNPHHPVGEDRRTYVAIKGRRAEVRSSPATHAYRPVDRPELNPSPTNAVQIERGPLFRAMKAYLPQPVKDWVKPLLRRVGLLPAPAPSPNTDPGHDPG